MAGGIQGTGRSTRPFAALAALLIGSWYGVTSAAEPVDLELGLVGAALIIGLLLVVLWRAFVIASQATDLFGRLAAAGVACWFGFQAFQNIGMCLGIMPVTGVPLPLVSYGGTSMFATLMAVGLLLNIHLRTQRAMGLGTSRTGVTRSRY